MELGELEPQAMRESGEGPEDTEGQELNDATFEPLSFKEQSGNYRQAEAIQGEFTALTDASTNIPIPAEVTGILMGEEPSIPEEEEKDDIPSRYAAGTSVPPPPDAGGFKSPKEDPNASDVTGFGADDKLPEKAMGSGADDKPPEKAMGSGADDMPLEKAPGSGADNPPEKAPGTGIDRPEPIEEPDPKEEQEMRHERDSDPSSRRK